MFIKEVFEMSVKAQIVELVNLVPDVDLPTLLEVVKHFVPAETDDVATKEDLMASKEALIEYVNGQTISHNDINWD